MGMATILVMKPQNISKLFPQSKEIWTVDTQQIDGRQTKSDHYSSSWAFSLSKSKWCQKQSNNVLLHVKC